PSVLKLSFHFAQEPPCIAHFISLSFSSSPSRSLRSLNKNLSSSSTPNSPTAPALLSAKPISASPARASRKSATSSRSNPTKSSTPKASSSLPALLTFTITPPAASKPIPSPKPKSHKASRRSSSALTAIPPGPSLPGSKPAKKIQRPSTSQL